MNTVKTNLVRSSFTFLLMIGAVQTTTGQERRTGTGIDWEWSPLAERVGLREEIHASLKTIFETNPLEREEQAVEDTRWWTEEQIEEYDEVTRTAWIQVWRRQRKTWRADQERQRTRRSELRAQLELVSQGILPERANKSPID